MCEVAQGVETQEAGSALEGVKGTKDRIDCGCIGGIFLKHEDTLLNALQQLHRLAVEFSQKSKILCEVEADRSPPAPEGTRVAALLSVSVARAAFSVGAQPSGQAGIAVPVCQADKTDAIQACHSLKLRMVSPVNFPGPSNASSNHARATCKPAVRGSGTSASASSSRSMTNPLIGRSPVSWSGATNASSSPRRPMISAASEKLGMTDSFGFSENTPD